MGSANHHTRRPIKCPTAPCRSDLHHLQKVTTAHHATIRSAHRLRKSYRPEPNLFNNDRFYIPRVSVKLSNDCTAALNCLLGLTRRGSQGRFFIKAGKGKEVLPLYLYRSPEAGSTLLLVLLVTILAKTLLTLVGSHLMALMLLSVWHSGKLLKVLQIISPWLRSS